MNSITDMRNAVEIATIKRNQCRKEAEAALEHGNTAMFRWYAQEAERYAEEVDTLKYAIAVAVSR